MIPQLLEGALGLAVVVLTLRDVFETVVVPGGPRGFLRMQPRLVRIFLPWTRRARRGAIGVGFAPTMLLLAFILWLLLLVLGFGLLAHACAGWFTPRLHGFGDALYVAGSSMATISVGDVKAHGPARLVAVTGAFCNLAVMTLAVTYLLEVQNNIAARDAGALKITTIAGRPPSALAVLERYADLDLRSELAQHLEGGRGWCATVLQSHATHPSLIYFRSSGAGSGWPATLGALMDLALVLEFMVDEPGAAGRAVLLREQADRLARELGEVVQLQPATVDTSLADVEVLRMRLRAAGYALREDRDGQRFVAARRRHAASIAALAHHLGTPVTPLLVPQEGAQADAKTRSTA
jgi:hypothetical protein